jgi:hypothetical protein
MRENYRVVVALPILFACGLVVEWPAQGRAAEPSPAAMVKEFETRVSPFDVGNRAQLFVDRVLVRDADRVWFTQHQGQKHPENPLIKADQPWEGWRVQVFGSVIYDEQERLFKMWYLADATGCQVQYFDDALFTCYATSVDGIHWQKPLVGTMTAKNGKPHNAVTHFFLPSVLKDMKEPDPSRRYKMVCWRQREPMGYHTCVSPDGLHWTELSKSPITHGGDVITAFWDARRELWIAFPKQGQVWRGQNRRVFSTIVSKDFEHWSDPLLSWTTDLRDDAGTLARVEQIRPLLPVTDKPDVMRTEYYGIGSYQAESCTIGFPWVFSVNNVGRNNIDDDGPQELQLAVSRDLVNWERPFRTPVVGIGELDRWDASYQMCAASAIRVGDEIRLYYAGANYTHGTSGYGAQLGEQLKNPQLQTTSSIGLATWKLDRFVSVDGPVAGGALTTVPIRFAGSRLEINASTRPGGSIVVELLDAAGRPLGGFPPSQAFSGDELRHRVVFSSKEDVSSLAGKPVVLRFKISDASLYSFAFRD